MPTAFKLCACGEQRMLGHDAVHCEDGSIHAASVCTSAPAHRCGYYRCELPATRVLTNFWGAPQGPLASVLNTNGHLIASSTVILYGSSDAYRCDAHAAKHDAETWNRDAQSVPIGAANG